MNTKTGYAFAMALSLMILLSGCGISKEIAANSIDRRSDVFTEEASGAPSSGSMAELVIKAQIKTNLEGFYILESGDSPHGKPTYPFLLNIDGQHVVWQMKGDEEHTPFYDTTGRKTVDGGPGMRYTLEKEVRVAPGWHKVFIALPGDDYYKEFEITLNAGPLNTLELKPVYLQDSRRRQSYLRGIKDLAVVLSSASSQRQ